MAVRGCGLFDTPVLEVHIQITVPEKPLKAHVAPIVGCLTKAAEFAVVCEKTHVAVGKALYYTWICRYFVASHVTSDDGNEFDNGMSSLGVTMVKLTVSTRPSPSLSVPESSTGSAACAVDRRLV